MRDTKDTIKSYITDMLSLEGAHRRGDHRLDRGPEGWSPSRRRAQDGATLGAAPHQRPEAAERDATGDHCDRWVKRPGSGVLGFAAGTCPCRSPRHRPPEHDEAHPTNPQEQPIIH